jgi:hypothetical protein
METRVLTIRVPKELLEQAEQFARERDTTLTRLVIAYLAQLAAAHDPLAGAPIVRRLSGSLSPDVTAEDYHRYLHGKSGRTR